LLDLLDLLSINSRKVVNSKGIREISFLMLRPAQIRAARGILGWRQEDLSKASGVGTATIYRIEKSDKSVTGYASTLLRIQTALEQAGIEFIENDDIGGFGLRFSKKKKR
jgi:transcriptional regulator with XRE-family HTH domain